MSYESNLLSIGELPANADLSTYQFHVVKCLSTSKIALCDGTTDLVPLGVLRNKPKADEPCDICILGVTQVMVGTAGSTAGARQMADADSHVTDATGDYPCVGIALASGVAGDLIPMLVTPPGEKGATA